MDITQFKKVPVMGIIRGISALELEPLLETVITAGLKTVEIALNTENAIELIKRAVKIAAGRLTIGAGTVLTRRSLEDALTAGASFIVSPICKDEIASYCSNNKIPFFPGALTPTEIYRAWRSGATMVKVFPATVFGPAYFKAVKGPFKEIELMAVGGVTVENAADYFSNGASAVAFGASIFRRDWLLKKRFTDIEDAIVKFLDVTQKVF